MGERSEALDAFGVRVGPDGLGTQNALRYDMLAERQMAHHLLHAVPLKGLGRKNFVHRQALQRGEQRRPVDAAAGKFGLGEPDQGLDVCVLRDSAPCDPILLVKNS